MFNGDIIKSTTENKLDDIDITLSIDLIKLTDKTNTLQTYQRAKKKENIIVSILFNNSQYAFGHVLKVGRVALYCCRYLKKIFKKMLVAYKISVG